MITIKKIRVSGEIDTDIQVEDTRALEICRKKLAQCYGDDNEFNVDFVLQTENFTDISYSKNKKK